jgi:zinc/manganese transport system substrate-binding protein
MILILRLTTNKGHAMKNAFLALTCLAAVTALAACDSDSDSGGDGPTVSATTGILADITAEVAGDDASIEQVIPDGASPHDFELSAQDRAEIEDSVLLVHNGSALEEGVPVDEIDIDQFALSEHAGELLPFEEAGEHHAEEEEHAGEEEHDHGSVDPHVWMDPTRVAQAVPALAEALAEADPEHADGYRERAREYVTELEALDGELQSTLAAVPAENRELVTSHDALGYFADRYDFEVIATPFPASGAEAEASAARINEVASAIREAEVPTIYAEQEDDPEVLELIAEETGVEVSAELLVENPGDAGSYVEMMRRDADLIAAGLGAPGAGG